MPAKKCARAPTGEAREPRTRSYIAHVVSLAGEDRGQSLVEFALTLPVLLLVVTGICTFSIAMNQYLMLTEATTVGARQLAISRGNTTDPCASVSSVVFGAAPLLKTSGLSFTFVINGATFTGTTCTGAVANLTAAQGTPGKLTVIYSACSLKVYNANYAPSCSLQAQTAELIQ